MKRAKEVGNIANIEKVLDKATALEWAYGREYYLNYLLRLQRVALPYRYTVQQAAGAFAALSPNNTEKGNWYDLISLMQAGYVLGDYSQARVSAYPLNRQKAIKILDGDGHPLEVLGGLKVRNFYINLSNPCDGHAVTVDFHMKSVCLGRVLKAKDREANMTANDYDSIAHALRFVAYERGLMAHQLQAIVWNVWKRFHKINYDPQEKMIFA